MLKPIGWCLAALALMVGFGTAPARAAEKVDLLLVLAADVSRSIDSDKYELQRKGYAAAMADPEVVRAIGAGATGRIAVAFVEWAGATSQRLVVDFTLVGNAAQATAFGAKVAAAPRSFTDRTAIGSAIDFSTDLLIPPHSRRSDASSISRATGPAMADATSIPPATRPWPGASPPSTASSS